MIVFKNFFKSRPLNSGRVAPTRKNLFAKIDFNDLFFYKKYFTYHPKGGIIIISKERKPNK